MIEQRIEIEFNRQVSSHTHVMALRSPGIAGAAVPGQFVMIRVRDGEDPLLRRPFSICGVLGDLFLLLYRVVGKGTAILARAGKGERLSVLGPLGMGFTVPGPPDVPVIVGGGIGVAPLFFLAQTLKDRNPVFLAGFETASSVLTMEKAGLPDLDVTFSTDDGTEGYGGVVTDLLEGYLNAPSSKGEALSVFACGPKPMLRKVAELSSLGGIPCQVSLEAGMACGLGACQGCGIPAARTEGRAYYHVCRDGPVFSSHRVDWKRL